MNTKLMYRTIDVLESTSKRVFGVARWAVGRVEARASTADPAAERPAANGTPSAFAADVTPEDLLEEPLTPE